MSSGKTAEVVRLLSRREIAGQSVLLITPARDTRVAPGEVVSRTGTRFPSVVAKDATSLRDEVLARDPDAVAIEEAQFFGPDLPAIIEELVAGPRTVIVSGLDQDFAGRPFATIPELLARADEVTKLTAICVKCGGEATRTQRMRNGKPFVFSNQKTGVGLEEIVAFIERQGLLTAA